MPALDFTIRMIVITCCHSECGIQFAVPETWERQRRADHSWFKCPNGHGQHFPGESDLERAKREKEESALEFQAQLNEEQHARLVAERERDKAVRAKRKIERRIAQGVCPCCNRTFSDLQRHMKTKHKDFSLPSAKDQKRIEGTIQ